MPVADEVLIAGGGIAAVRTAQALRTFGFDGRLTIFTEEAHLPYDRPPLSKAYLVNRRGTPPEPILTNDELAARGISIELGRRATRLDTAARWLILDDEETVPYDALVLATGARPRSLAVLRDSEHAQELRTAGDARRIAAAMRPEAHMVVVGAGFVGLEVAAAGRMNGCRVTVIEVRDTPFVEIVGQWLGGELQRWHERRGVEFICGESIDTARDERGRSVLTLAGGQTLEADIVVVGVGVQPAVEWLRDTPALDLDSGVLCDRYGQTSVPWVYAVGDVAQRMDGARRLPTGHWTAATEQAMCTAATMLGRFADRRPATEMYFWSDQHGCRLQCAGQFPAHGEVTLESGSLDDWSFLATCRVDGELVGVFAADSPGPFVRARAALRRSAERPIEPTTGLLTDVQQR
jgi:3-phenylpropionate/trans-cinnamate dioxygenase ferredoxin reductase subunit